MLLEVKRVVTLGRAVSKEGRWGLLGTDSLFLGLGAYYIGVFMKLNT